jgi:hypothetical protein
MVICPIALAVHCTGCPLVKVCPLKTILGDYGKEETRSPSQQTADAPARDDEVQPGK